MSASPEDLQVILEKRAWKVWKGVGSFLLFDFGRRLRSENGSVRGTYTLWIYMAEWRIKKARRELAHSESSDSTIHRAAVTLTGKKLESISLRTHLTKRNVRHGASFLFEGGYSLLAWGYERAKNDDDVFFVYLPGRCLSYCCDGSFASGPME